MRAFYPAAFLFCICSLFLRWAPASAEPGVPAALAHTLAFRGRVLYRAHRAERPAAVIDGTLVVNAGSWELEERSATSLLHVANDQSWIRVGTQTAVFDDPFQVDALANSWAVVLGASAQGGLSRDPGGASWTTGTGVRIFLDPSQDEVIGASDARISGSASFVYGQWTTQGGLALPQSILRLHSGTNDTTVIVDSYQVQWAPDGASTGKGVVRDSTQPPPVPTTHEAGAPVTPTPSPWRPFTALFALLALALGFVVWSRRDALVAGLSRRLAADPRAWRREGVDLFVSPEGILYFEGRRYRVGAEFFASTALVQSSPLFIRVSAPNVPRAVVMARKFPRWQDISTRNATAGFSLIESLAATALFATVVVGAVFPAMIVLARADRVAAQHETATQIAANALADEEAALAYGTTISDGSATSTVAGMTLRVTVDPAGMSQLHAITVDVSGADGRPLARMVTLAGPPVPPPGAPSPGSTAPGTTR